MSGLTPRFRFDLQTLRARLFMTARYGAKACAVAVAFLLLADTSLAQKEAGFVSLALTSISTYRSLDPEPADGALTYLVIFKCNLLVDNETGVDLAVPSQLGTAFGNLELVVTDLKGKVLSQQPYYASLSARQPKSVFPISQGTTEVELRFPVFGLGQEVKAVKVRLVGTFPGSAYKRICSSDTAEVTFDESRREAQ